MYVSEIGFGIEVEIALAANKEVEASGRYNDKLLCAPGRLVVY